MIAGERQVPEIRGQKSEMILLLRREIGDDFFEARVAAQWVVPRRQFKSAVAEKTR